MCIISWDNCRHLFLITANTHVALKKLMRKQELTASINNRTSIYILCAQKSSHWSDKSKDLTTFREYRYLASDSLSKIPVSIQPFVWTTLKVRKKIQNLWRMKNRRLYTHKCILKESNSDVSNSFIRCNKYNNICHIDLS